MAKSSLNSQLVSIGVKKSYASLLVSGRRKPSLALAIRIYRGIGVKLGPIAKASDAEIAALENVARRTAAPSGSGMAA